MDCSKTTIQSVCISVHSHVICIYKYFSWRLENVFMRLPSTAEKSLCFDNRLIWYQRVLVYLMSCEGKCDTAPSVV